MASNRKLPFGYRMELGEIQPHPQEAEAVRWIFQQYLAGVSYNALADDLQEQGVPYDGDKPWNKNMVARILENGKYTGGAGYPPILTSESLTAAQARRAERTSPSQKTPAQKELRRLCGGNPPKYVEGQVLGILNRLIQHPETIRAPEASSQDGPEIQRLRRELDCTLHSPPVDEEQARKTSFYLAALCLNSIGSEEYETQRLRRLFQNSQPMTALDRDILHQSVWRITYKGKITEILLKNGQIVKED